MLSNVRLNVNFASGGDYSNPNLSAALKHAHGDCLILRPASCNLFCTLVLVHIASLPTNEGFVGLIWPESLLNVPVCMAWRIRWSMNHADLCVTLTSRPIS